MNNSQNPIPEPIPGPDDDFWEEREIDFSNGIRGPVVPLPPGKIKATITLDKEVLDWFMNFTVQRGGGNYQTLMNQVLRDFISKQSFNR